MNGIDYEKRAWRGSDLAAFLIPLDSVGDGQKTNL
jgi:hypothetical protein